MLQMYYSFSKSVGPLFWKSFTSVLMTMFCFSKLEHWSDKTMVNRYKKAKSWVLIINKHNQKLIDILEKQKLYEGFLKD